MSAIHIENLTCTKCGSPFQGALEVPFPPNLIREGICQNCFNRLSIRLNFITYYACGNTKAEMRFLPEYEANFVIKALLDRMFQGGHPSEDSYDLVVDRTNTRLAQDETLEQAGAEAGDLLFLLKKYSFSCENCGKEWKESAIEDKEVICPVCGTQPEDHPEFSERRLYTNQKANHVKV